MRKLKKIITPLALIGILLSMLPALALSGDTSNSDGSATAPAHQISIMSFNVLDYETENKFDTPLHRFDYVIDTIRAYQPDVIGIQEAAVAASNNGHFDWPSELKNELSDIYDSRTLTDDNPTRQMKIGNGLIIFWKKARFSRINSAAVQYKNINYTTAGGVLHSDTSRDFHYVKLFDSTYKTYFYMFNTHLSINPKNFDGNSSATTEEERYAGKVYRTKEIIQLSDKMKELASDCPCFATGDYNCNFSSSGTDPLAEDTQLTRMSYQRPFASSSQVASYNYPQSFDSIIDHCFVNTNYTEVISRRVIYRDVNGWQPSDHRAVMTYASYRAKATFNNDATYDPIAETLTAHSSEPTYTLSITPATNKFSYAVYNSAGRKITGALPLTDYINRFSIRFYSSTATQNSNVIFSSVALTIYYDAGEQIPGEITCEGALGTYFTDNSYYVLLDSTVTSADPVVTGGVLYTDKTCWTAAILPVTVTPGEKTYYVQLPGGVYPLHLMRVNAIAESRSLYVDGSLNGVTGRAAYTDGDGVRVVTVGINGFATVKAAVAAAKTGDSIFISPGTYKETVTCDASKNLRFYGNNRDISPISKNGNVWSLSVLRRPETIIEGQLSFTQSGTNGSITIHGITFTGVTSSAPLYYNANDVKKTVTLDIARNVFSATTTNTVNGSELQFNNAAHKNGTICDNYFGSTSDFPCTTLRSITMRNPDGVVVDGNYFFNTNNMFLSAEVSNNSTAAGNLNITFSYNRFEHCESISAYYMNVTSATTGHAKFLYNDFIRCGYTGNAPLCFLFHGSSVKNAPVPEFKNCSLDVIGNRFINCKYGLTMSRSKTSAYGTFTDMRIDVHQNRFITPNSFQYQRVIYVSVYADTAETVDVDCPLWDMSGNYFSSGQTVSHDPADFTQFAPISAEKPTVRVKQTPYYLDANLTILSNSTPMSTLTGVSAAGGSFAYDGTPKSITVTAPEGCTLSYSTDNVNFSSVLPTITEAGTLTVYYMAEKAGYHTVTGNATVTVEPKYPTDITLPDQTVTYSSTGQTLVINGVQPGDEIIYRCGSTEYADMPIFTDIGTYTVSAAVRRPGYSPVTVTGSITILPGTLEGVSAKDTTVPYDGTAHAPEITGGAADDVIRWSVNGGAFQNQITGTENIGTYTVRAEIIRKNYEPLITSAVLTVTPGIIPGVTLSYYSGISDGTAHAAVLAGSQPEDVIQWSADGEHFSAAPVSFTDAGYHAVWCKVSRANYTDLILQSGVLLCEAQPDVLIPALRKEQNGALTVTLAFGTAYTGQDLKVTDITVRTGADLTAYLSGGTDETLTVLTVRTGDMGVKRLQNAYPTALQGTDPAAVFLTYEVSGTTYTRIALL